MTERRAVVTGGCKGIGAAIATRLEADGLSVVRADLPAAAGAWRAGGGTAVDVDVSDTRSVDAMIAAAVGLLGGLDVMVNNAGVAEQRARVDAMPDSDWDRVISVNLGGAFRCTRAAFDHLRASGHGAVVSLSSTWGLGGVPGYAAYCASKAGIIGLTRAMAADGGPFNIRVNAVSPGYVANDMGGSLDGLDAEAAARAWAGRDLQASFQPLGRQCDVAEIAAAVSFLVSDQASFVTGTVLPVDGGQSNRLNTGEQQWPAP
ncbi:SDR family NAD(P)-dependent oxidoreductase [Nakamurella endophytica]|nr:SDR family oxidoreductase [Nakamurella endophytica]